MVTVVGQLYVCVPGGGSIPIPIRGHRRTYLCTQSNAPGRSSSQTSAARGVDTKEDR